jgi:Helix-turn-helix domain
VRWTQSPGPVQQLAGQLRQLRQKAGNPGYRELARATGYSATTLSDAAGGRRLPGLPVVRSYAAA